MVTLLLRRFFGVLLHPPNSSTVAVAYMELATMRQGIGSNDRHGDAWKEFEPVFVLADTLQNKIKHFVSLRNDLLLYYRH